MILTCPECATRYFVPDDSVGSTGRTVRCANCGTSWRAEPETPLDLTPEAATPAHEGEAPVEPSPGLTGEDLPRAFRQRISAQRRAKKAVTASAVWAAAGLVVIGLLTLLIVGRETVARAWPHTASVYAAVGLPVNLVGLAIEEQQAALGYEDGRPAVLVTGALRNVSGEPVTAPPLRITLLDGEDNTIGVKVSRITNAQVPAGETRRFAVRLQDPPESVANVEIGFELGEAPAAEGLRDRAHAAPVEAELRPAADVH
ncbi:MAG: DUF3426 domain-containing protein [Pseudomonadota bacterium]|nr:DUF3426 domain-containing protein [Pseudomonadota bacterium]